MELNGIERDPATIEAGQWVTDIPDAGDLELRVRGMSSNYVMSVRNRKERRVPNDQRERDGTLKPDTALLVLGETMHEAILLEWRNLKNGGESIPYSSDMAKTLCTERRYLPFQNYVAWAANYVDRGRKDEQVALEKNS